MPPRRDRRLPLPAVGLALGTMLTAVLLLLPPFSGPDNSLVFDDLAELVVAAAAAGCAFWRSFRPGEVAGRTWRWIGAGCASWAVGEGLWSWYEVWQGIETPFPSLADIGYLLFPVAVCIGLLTYPGSGSGGGTGRTRRLLDAAMITCSLGLAAWQTVLSAVLDAGADTQLALAVSVAYPILDLGVLILTVLTLSKLRTSTLPLWLMAAGVVALSISDSAFAYLAAASSYEGGIVDLGWFVGFLLLALAALADVHRPVPSDADAAATDATVLGRPQALPYVPVVLALVSTTTMALFGQRPTTGQLLLETVVVVLLLGRQYLALRENSTLTRRLAVREAELHHQAFHDGLTALANRELFQDRLTHALALHTRDRRPVSVLFLDLDDFKLVNDTLGHAAGDELLVQVSERLLNAVRTGDTVARFGGDEFAVLVEDGGEATIVAEKLSQALAAPFLLGSHTISVRASIGVFALDGPDAALPSDELLAHADTAMYAAKRAGKARTVIHRPGMAPVEMTDERLANGLADALQSGSGDETLVLHYSPVVEVTTGLIRGVEAVARWALDGQDVPSVELLELAERTGLLPALTTWILDQACRDVAGWCEAPGFSDGWVAVRTPLRQVASRGFSATVSGAIREHGLRPGQLLVELPDSGSFPDREAGRAAVVLLRHLGVRVSIDDPGTGHSPLGQLGELPMDAVRVRRSSVSRLDTDVQQSAALRSLLGVATELALDVLVEGIDRPAQLDALRAMSGPLAHGYLLQSPRPAAGIRALLDEVLVC